LKEVMTKEAFGLVDTDAVSKATDARPGAQQLGADVAVMAYVISRPSANSPASGSARDAPLLLS
jgi:hypothetical protein